MAIQQELATLYLVRDTSEVWDTYCRECAGEVGKEMGLVWDTYPFQPEAMHTPNGVERPEDELAEPLVYAPEIHESDTPQACAKCDLWLDCSLTKDGVEYLTDEFNDFPQEVIDLYLGERLE